jgi:hypothetical protein
MAAEDVDEPTEPGEHDEAPDSGELRAKCPRCGGIGAPPRYRPRANPFLFKPKPGHLVCEDCGLDYWDTGHNPPSSGKSPW